MTCLIDYPQSGRGMLQLPFRVTARDESIQSYIRANVVVLSGSVANPDDNSRERNQTLDFLKILENDPNPSSPALMAVVVVGTKLKPVAHEVQNIACCTSLLKGHAGSIVPAWYWLQSEPN